MKFMIVLLHSVSWDPSMSFSLANISAGVVGWSKKKLVYLSSYLNSVMRSGHVDFFCLIRYLDHAEVEGRMWIWPRSESKMAAKTEMVH